MLGMVMPAKSFPILKATGQTLRIGNQYGIIWNPDVDYSPYIPIGYSGYAPSFTKEEVDVMAQFAASTYYIGAKGAYINTPWLARMATKDGEAALNVLGQGMVPYLGTDDGSTPYKVLVTCNGGYEAWGFLGASGTGGVGAEMLTGWTELVQGDYDFSTFTTSGSTVTEMAVDGVSKSAGLAESNAVTITAGHKYYLSIFITRVTGTIFPRLYYGTHEAVSGTYVTLATGQNNIEIVATSAEAAYNRFWLYVGGISDFTGCTFSMQEATEYVTGDELITGWTEDTSDENWVFKAFSSSGSTITEADVDFADTGSNAGCAVSNQLSLVEGRLYRLYIESARTSYADTTTNDAHSARPYSRFGSAIAADGPSLGSSSNRIAGSVQYSQGLYREWVDYPAAVKNYYEFTATAAIVAKPYLWYMHEGTSRCTNITFSLKEIVVPGAVLGGIHIVSTDGGSTRNWTSIEEGFVPNDIRSYQIMAHDAVSLSELKYRIQIRDISTGKWARGWLGAAGSGEGTHNHNTIETISKADPGIVTLASPQDGYKGYMWYFYGLSQMTELNTKYRTSAMVNEGAADTAIISDTSGYGAAETTGGETLHIYQPPATALKVFSGKDVADANSGLQYWESIEIGFTFNRTDYEVYITLER